MNNAGIVIRGKILEKFNESIGGVKSTWAVGQILSNLFIDMSK